MMPNQPDRPMYFNPWTGALTAEYEPSILQVPKPAPEDLAKNLENPDEGLSRFKEYADGLDRWALIRFAPELPAVDGPEPN